MNEHGIEAVIVRYVGKLDQNYVKEHKLIKFYFIIIS
jgi:hypothetical protein